MHCKLLFFEWRIPVSAFFVQTKINLFIFLNTFGPVAYYCKNSNCVLVWEIIAPRKCL